MSGLPTPAAVLLEQMEIVGCWSDADVQEGVFVIVILHNLKTMEKEAEFYQSDRKR